MKSSSGGRVLSKKSSRGWCVCWGNYRSQCPVSAPPLSTRGEETWCYQVKKSRLLQQCAGTILGRWESENDVGHSVVFPTWGRLCPGQETAGPVRCPPPHSPAGGAECPGCCVSGWWRRPCSPHQSDWEFHSDPPAAAPHRTSRTDPACAAESWAGWLLPPAGRQRQHSSGSTAAADFCRHWQETDIKLNIKHI